MQDTLRDVIWAASLVHANRTALVDDGRGYSYQEVRERAAGIASRLVDVGVRPGTTVAVCAPPSALSVIGMLGVLYAGGVYVPIDPRTPANRMSELLEDCQSSIALGDQSLAGQEAFQELLTIDPLRDSHLATALPSVSLDGSSLAYVAYTSGSTGRPRGVAVERHSLANYVHSLTPVYEISPEDRILLFSSIALDWSLEEHLLPLCAGATLVTPRDRQLHAPRELAHALKDDVISVVGLPSSSVDQLSAFLRGGDASLVASLRLLISGGEELTPQAWARWDSLGLEIPIINTYGPTEATIVTTYHRLEPGAEYTHDVPIGRSIDNSHIYILDEYLSPVADGEEGEIVIGGEGVAQGYLGDPTATAERFLADPFIGTPGGRMYRTGDRGLLDPSDSNLRFLGRLDNQVKLSGYRIEPEEIEAALRLHPEVSGAVVILSEEPRRLIAYITTQRDGPTSRQLRQFLGSRLPDYMVPSHFVALESLPLGTNGGSVDRSKLPSPDVRYGSVATPVDLPLTTQEQAIAEIFADVLGLDLVGRLDNFFELGGDSIQSIQVVSRAGQYGLLLSPRDVYQHQTVAAIADHAKSAAAGDEPKRLVGPSTVPLTPSQAWFFEQEFDNPNTWTNSMWLSTTADEALIKEALEAMTERHEALKVRFERVGDDWVQYIPSTLHGPSVTVVNIAALEGDERESAVEKAIGQLHDSIDIVDGPLWSAGILESSEENFTVIVGHHLVMDGVSFLLLEDEFDQLVSQARSDRPLGLAPALSLSAWTRGLQEYASSPELREEHAYWRDLLTADIDPVPLDKPRDARLAKRAEFITVQIGGEDASLFRDVVRRIDLRSDAIFLGALVLSMQEWRPGPFRVFVEGHCRGDVFPGLDASRTVGWLQCYFPVVVGIEASGPWSTVQAIHNSLEETPNGGLGFGVLRHMVAEDASKAVPLLMNRRELAFNFEGYMPSGAMQPPEMTRQPAKVEHGLLDESASEMRGSGSPLLIVNARATDQVLRTKFVYDGQVLLKESITYVANAYVSIVQNLLRSGSPDIS